MINLIELSYYHLVNLYMLFLCFIDVLLMDNYYKVFNFVIILYYNSFIFNANYISLI
jgi:hypothetical protein